MRLNRLVIFCMMILCIGAGTALAGKAERDMKKKITAEKLKPAIKAMKDACKCGTALTVDWKAFKVKDHMREAGREIYNVGETVTKFCKADDESRGLYCKNVKAITITLHEKGSPETVKKGKKITIKTCKAMNSGGYEPKAILESF